MGGWRGGAGGQRGKEEKGKGGGKRFGPEKRRRRFERVREGQGNA